MRTRERPTLARRGFLTGLVALPAAAAVAVPVAVNASPAGAEGDAELQSLFDRWLVSARRGDETTEALWAAEERHVFPPRPEALFRQPRDGAFFGLGFMGHVHEGRSCYDRASDIDFIASHDGVVGRVTAIEENGSTCELPGFFDPEAKARRDEIVSAYEQWQADQVAAGIASGLTVANDANKAANDENSALRLAIIAAPARTFRGVEMKARVLLWCHGDLDELDETIADMTNRGEAHSGAVALSIARDVVALIERSAA